jgi:hypothetical protein
MMAWSRYFLNQLRCGYKASAPSDAPPSGGFSVGHDTEACTRGIWLWLVASDAWDHPSDPSARLLLLDTECLASTDQDETYDAKVFSLGILLSSLFVYNSMGVVDEAAIDRLFLVGELAKSICISTRPGSSAPEDPDNPGSSSAAESEAELAQFFPPFVWLLRDFSLNLKKNGEAITPAEYLVQALAARADKGNSRRVRERNRIRQSFRALFRERELSTLVRPAADEEALRNLGSIPPEQLRPEFCTALAAIKAKLLSRVEPKQLFGERGVSILEAVHID